MVARLCSPLVVYALLIALAVGLLPLISRPDTAHAASVPAGFSDSLYVSGLNAPTAMAFAPDGRLFVAEQGGRLRVVKDGVLLPQPFLTLSVSSSGERGLLGVAFDPQFATNGWVYVYYTATTPTVHNRVSRFTANGDVAVAGSEVIILELDNLSAATNHNGGALHFGPDGRLYIAVGDNADGSNAQTLQNLLGKILRINKDGTIPSDNPFFSQTSGRNRAIWALGLRNPFTFAFQPGTGRMHINDVGQSAWEEINLGRRGANYGWPATEGPTNNPSYDSPIFAYRTSEGCAITGGAFYNPAQAQFPSEYVGDYFFADLCGGWIRRLDLASGSVTTFATGANGPVDLKVGPDGSLFYLSYYEGSVRRIQHQASAPPAITSHPASITVPAGQPASFSVSASGTPPLSYQWQRNEQNIPGATGASYTLPSTSPTDNNARFRVIVSNTVGSVISNTATLTVTSNTPPVATITQPAAGTSYNAGQTIFYAGSATDAQDGQLPASAFTWEVVFHHDTHTHPFILPTSGATSGSFVIPDTGHTETNVWYRIRLTVRDAGGLEHTVERDIDPNFVNLSFATDPPGLQVTLDDQPLTTPATVPSVVGVRRKIGAVSPQPAGDGSYVFASWSDGGAEVHEIVTPSSPATYTARYVTDSGGAIADFDALPGSSRLLSGQHPVGVIDWGLNQWWLSSPWGSFTTKSVSFSGPGITSRSFTFLQPARLVRFDAYNGGPATTVRFSCPGQPSVEFTLAFGQLRTVDTGWTGTCTTVTVFSSNGWDTNFDNFVIEGVEAGPPPHTTPPEVRNLRAELLAPDRVRILWETDEPATSAVQWGLTTAYGNTTPVDTTLKTSHSVEIGGLAAGQTYNYRARSRDEAGNEAVSANATFSTLANDLTITFNDATGQSRLISGQYPTGVIDWGVNQWWLSAPWGRFTTKSVSFSGPGITSRSFTFLRPTRLLRLEAYNGGLVSSTLRFSCAGLPERQVTLAPGQLTTVDLAWNETCTTVTVFSSNGWDTNLDNLVIEGGAH